MLTMEGISESESYFEPSENPEASVMYGNTYTRRHRARDVRRAAERAGRLIQQAAPDPAGSQA
jgi:hypothetical protein